MSFMQNVMMKMGQDKSKMPSKTNVPGSKSLYQEIKDDEEATLDRLSKGNYDYTNANKKIDIPPPRSLDRLDRLLIDEGALDNDARAISEYTGATIDQAKRYILNNIDTYNDEDIDMLSSSLAKKEQEHIDAMTAFRAKNKLDFDTKNRKQLLKGLGYTGAGAGLGGLGGYYLAKLIDDSATAKAIGTVLGTGLGGSLGYLYGDTAKDKAVEGYNYLKNLIV